MISDFFKIPKALKNVTLWVHPDGPVVGGIYIKQQSNTHRGNEDPYELFNETTPFLVFQVQQPQKIRFYNRASIIRAEYREDDPAPLTSTEYIDCQLQMMDGAFFTGQIRELLPPDHPRLFDYLNRKEERFIRLYSDENNICLVNKSYIIHATNLSDGASLE
jgi:hypothetical protein